MASEQGDSPIAVELDAVLRRRARASYLVAVSVFGGGVVLASLRFPGGFDWVYTVMSALASRKHNPEGSAWFAGGVGLSFVLLAPLVQWLRRHDGARRGLARFGLRALQVGLLFGILVGVERLAFFHLSHVVRKGHELLALVSFLGLYAGVLALHVDRFRRGATSLWPALLAVGPLAAIGLSQLGLYLDQRDLGWVDRSWRDLGVPPWLSFAFWQWLAALGLWASLGMLVIGRSRRAPS